MDFFSMGIPAGRYFDIPVRLHFTFVIFAFYRLQAFAHIGIGFGLAYLTGLYLCILLHEFGHALAARWCDGEADQIILWPLGGLAFCSPAFHPTAHLITTVAGPFVTLVLWLMFWGLAAFDQPAEIQQGEPGPDLVPGLMKQGKRLLEVSQAALQRIRSQGRGQVSAGQLIPVAEFLENGDALLDHGLGSHRCIKIGIGVPCPQQQAERPGGGPGGVARLRDKLPQPALRFRQIVQIIQVKTAKRIDQLQPGIPGHVTNGLTSRIVAPPPSFQISRLYDVNPAATTGTVATIGLVVRLN